MILLSARLLEQVDELIAGVEDVDEKCAEVKASGDSNGGNYTASHLTCATALPFV